MRGLANMRCIREGAEIDHECTTILASKKAFDLRCDKTRVSVVR